YIIAEMDPAQARWFQENIVDEFNDEHHTNLQVRSVENEQIVSAIRTARTHGNDIILAVLSSDLIGPAVRDGLVAPFDGVVSPSRIRDDLDHVRPELMRWARAHDRQFFLPRMAVLDVATYRVSMVRDAMLHWQLVRADIDTALRS